MIPEFQHGLTVASLAIFAGAGGAAVAVIVTHVGGQWTKIRTALRGPAPVETVYPSPRAVLKRALLKVITS
ncbi:hypothetical protein [uncultured Sphingomonas sp.]|uniref:hypothetical protein n=1 Tax=uncultured Sphingomonas sp. TaxID=158754 RepID=UPI0025DC62B2|nr:hypothetical protein [uncultured Sphingomonas sp.]